MTTKVLLLLEQCDGICTDIFQKLILFQKLTYAYRSHLIEQLVKLSQTAPSVHIDIPPEVTQYVESSRNPDIFTREFVETVQRMNQLLKGRHDAYRLLQETLARDFILSIPELKDDINKAVEVTGGKAPPARIANI